MPLDETWARQTADQFDKQQHEPNNPDVAASYAQLKADTLSQYNHILNNDHVTLSPWTHAGQPYANSAEMINDIAKNKNLHFFTGGDIPSDHPMAERHSNGLTYNDMFRAAHDFFGHSAMGNQFGPRGEENAWLAHSRMFHPIAIPAMTAETKAQNNWVNFGKHLRDPNGSIPKQGETGFIHPSDRPYAQQKATIMGPKFSDVHHYDTPKVQLIEDPDDDGNMDPSWNPESYFTDIEAPGKI